MEIPLNIAIIGERNGVLIQAIARVHSTNKPAPIIQITTTRRKNETDESYIFRLQTNLRELIKPYSYAHQIVIFCRYEIRNDLLSNDAFQNLSARFRHIALNSENHMERVKALSMHLDLINSL